MSVLRSVALVAVAGLASAAHVRGASSSVTRPDRLSNVRSHAATTTTATRSDRLSNIRSAAAPPVVTSIFTQSEAASIYTSVGTTIVGGAPFIAVADGLNAPEFVELYDGTGTLAWSFSNGTGSYITDTARHAEAAGAGVSVFTAVMPDAGGDVALYGFSTASGGVPAWRLDLPGCSTDTGATALPPNARASTA